MGIEKLRGVPPGTGTGGLPANRPAEGSENPPQEDATRDPTVPKDVQIEVRKAATELPNPIDITAQFIVDQKTHQVTVRILNIRTGEVIRIIPPGKLMELVSQLANRSVIDRKV